MGIPEIKIRNVVASFSLSPMSNLREIHKAFAKECFFETIYDRKFGFKVVALRIEKPKMSLLIYNTGKVVCTGAKTVKDAEQSAGYLINRLRRVGLDAEKKTEAKIQNIVATTDLKTFIDLEKFISDTRAEKKFHVIFEPEQFPAAIVKFSIVQGSLATVLVFSSGKIVCVGLTSCDQIREAIRLLVSKLRQLDVMQ